ncbi:hypothetical protein ABIE91_000838 [Bradyrhizobium elkanii]
MVTEALLAHVAVMKYGYQLPLYRQEQMFAAQGITLDRQTLASWMGRAAWWLKPLHALLRRAVMSYPRLFADETPLPVLDPGRGRTKVCQFWAIATDDRPWGGPAPPAVVCVFTEDRKAIRARQLFGDYNGILQVDGYAGYKGLIKNGGRLVQLAFCFAHARRKFWDVHVATKSPIAAEALQRIAMFYAIEDRIRGLPATQRAAVRQSDTRPLIEDFKPWLEARLLEVSKKSGLGKAIRYTLNHWEGLTRLIDDGRIEIGRVDDWRGDRRSRGFTVSGGFRLRRCRSSHHSSVSSRRSSNRACRFAAPGFHLSPQTFALDRSVRRLGMRKSLSVLCR